MDPYNYGHQPEPKTSGLAIFSLVLGIVSVLFCWLCLSFLSVPGVICGHMALRRIKDSDGAITGHGLAVGGLVTGYFGVALTVVMVPFMAAIALPNFVKARNVAMANQCQNNLRTIDAAKNQWALEHRAKTGDVPKEDELKPYLKGGVLPVCPAHGIYTIGAVGDDPACSFEGHTILQVGRPANSRATPNTTTTTKVTFTVTTQPQAPAHPAKPLPKAEGTFIPMLNRVDMIHNPKDNILYISAGDTVQRYDLGSNKLLAPITVGGDLRGVDLSLDNKTLAVADAAGGSNGRIGIHLINLETDKVTDATFGADAMETGTFSVAFGADGQVWVTASISGSGFAPLRKYNPPTRSAQRLQTVAQDTMLAPSPDHQTIGFAESAMTPGSYGRILYRAVQLPKAMRANSFLFEVGISRDGSQLAVPEPDDLILAGSAVPKLEEKQILSVVYHPQKDYFFFTQAGTSLVSVYDSKSVTKVKDLSFGDQFEWNSRAFQDGRLRISRDGKFLFCTVNGGIRYAATGL